jgi:hypothetical protein
MILNRIYKKESLLIGTEHYCIRICTTLQLHPTPCHPRKASYTMEHTALTLLEVAIPRKVRMQTNQPTVDKSTVGVGSQVDIDSIGTLKTRFLEEKELRARGYVAYYISKTRFLLWNILSSFDSILTRQSR